MAAMAKMYGTRPSEILGVPGSYEAYCLDHALFVKLGHHLAEQSGESRRRFAPHGYEPPPQKVRAQIPWHGDGPDPLQGPS